MSSNNQQPTTPLNQSSQQLNSASMQQLAYRFTTLVNDAKRVGISTSEGQELLKKASKIKAVYENYNRQRQQAAQSFGQTKQGLNTSINSTTPSDSLAQTSITNDQQRQNINNNNSATKSGSNNESNNIRMLLTPQQSETYNKISETFNENAKNIKGEYEYLKRNIEVLDTEIKNRSSEPMTVKQLEAKKNELLVKLRGLNTQFHALTQKLKNDKKKFYIECAATNPNLKRFFQATTQQHQKANGSNINQQSTCNNSSQTSQQQMTQTAIVTSNKTASTPQQPQSPSQQPQQQSRSPAQITPVNAAANQNSVASTRAVIFKQPNPSIQISETVQSIPNTSISYRSNRPTITAGSAMSASALTTPIMTKLPPYEVDSERIMSKRKLRELVKSIGVDEGDGETTIDGDVEELLLDLADDFITNVTSFACRLAKHRKSDNLDIRDIQIHLERNWNIRIPGYAGDEIRSTRKWNPTTSYNQRLQGISNTKMNKQPPTTSSSIDKK